ncbi:uncharacterized protein LOC125655639 [Ostrea edulis]|uniref:uncharacterized protein LOC125655639 n=1 Tax=Ostrea edulis TaxID=37623 RepID=UPI0024AE91E3|nr:uncharacterized protein LOC125655639 [Ostrea edulis]
MAPLIRILNIFGGLFAFLIVGCQQVYYHAEFRLKAFGKLSNNNYRTIFSAVGATFAESINSCSKFCSEDQRCIGIETCQIREDLFQCRVCCEWKKMGNNVDKQPGCKYLEMGNESGENLASTANLSTVYLHHGQQQLVAAHAVDGFVLCPGNLKLAHSAKERNPLLSIVLKRKDSNVKRVVLYNRQNCCGHQLHDVHVNIIDNGTNYPCGFYPGPAITGHHIVFLCRNGSVGNSIKIQISSKDGQTDWFSVCEVEVYGTS